MAKVDDVAAYILSKSRGPMTTMKLQKLCYYSQGYSLVWDGVPLFDEPIQAWANGPVVYELYRQHRGRFQISSWERGNPDRLTDAERETIDAVWEGYGHLNGQQLSDLTHAERPWVEARGSLPPGARSDSELRLDTMQDFFGGIATSE